MSLEATFTLIIESDGSESASGETGCNDMDFACQIMLSVGSGEGTSAGMEGSGMEGSGTSNEAM